MKKSDTNSLIIFLSGVTVGATAMFFLTSEKGKEFRDELQRKAYKKRKKLRKKWKALRSKDSDTNVDSIEVLEKRLSALKKKNAVLQD